jgi:TonB-linked SusC/RagA family outer membrane protein
MKQLLQKKNRNRLIGLVILTMLGSYPLLAQDRVITGRLTDETGMEMPGVNVLLKGTTVGTTSNSNGSYTIAIPAGENNPILVFSFIGYANTEEIVGQRTVIDLVLQPSAETLSEVVVVGYGTQSKATVTGAIVAVDGADLIQNRTPNVLNSLTGTMPGVFVNSRSGEPGRENPTILIRGKSTPGDTSPLIIVDGVQRLDLARLNPNDIETISVLKDASAAIYGARAANGVILVTTKRGKKGKPVFDFSYNAGFTQPTRQPKMADSYTFAKAFNENVPNTYTDEELEKFRVGKEEGYTSTNFYKEMTRTLTPQHQMNLSTSGGTDNVNYYIALGELKQQGHFKNGSTELKRYNFRSNIDVKVTDYLKIGLDLSGRVDNKTYPGRSTVATIDAQGVYNPGQPDTRGVYSHMYLYRPMWTLYWPGTDYLRPNRDSESIVNWVSDNSGVLTENYKGLESRLHFELGIPGVEGLSIRGTANYDVSFNRRKTWSTPTYVHTRTGTTGNYVYTQTRSGSSASLAGLNEFFEQRIIPTFNAQINYEKSIGKHNLGAMVGYEQMENKYEFVQVSRSDFPSSVLDQLFAGSADRTKSVNLGSGAISARQNYFGRATYDYSRKYLLQLIFRYDGSSQFPTNKQWGFFPGASVGWRVSEEAFMDNVAAVDEFKLRASYGQMGNDNVRGFQHLTAYGFSNNYVVGGNDVIGLGSLGQANPSITWEVVKTSNVGFELSLWNGLLSAQFDYFKTTRSNILLPRTAVIPDYVGIPQLPDENYGEAENKGFELNLTHTRTINKFTYSVGGNISYARNKVIVGTEPPSAEPYQALKGKPVGAKQVYQAMGIFNTIEDVNAYPHLAGAAAGDIQYRDVNGDGFLNSLDQVRLNETATPQIIYAINASARYANFDLSILFQGQEKAIANFYETTDNLQDKNFYFPIMNPNGLGNFTQWRADDHWTPDNIDGSQPRVDASNSTNNATNPSTHWVFDAGFLRLKNVELGYTLPAAISQKIKIQNLRLYVNGNNLLLLKDSMKDLGFDPETTDYWYYPNQRTLNIGANITF